MFTECGAVLDNGPRFPIELQWLHSLLRIRLVMFRSLVLNYTVRFLSALVLLVSVMVSPVRPNAASGVSSPNHLNRDFGVPAKAPAHHRPHVPCRIVQVKAVSCESRLKGVGPPSPLRIAPPSMLALSPESATASSRFRIDRAYHSLRC
jgi:hypothetical protein